MASEIFIYLAFLFLLMITAVESGDPVDQNPRFKLAKRGESASISCKITATDGEILGTHFKRNPLKPEDLCYVSAESTYIAESHRGRLECNKTVVDGTINIWFGNLQINDTDFYYCVTGVQKGRVFDINGKGTLLIVSDLSRQPCGDNCVEEENCKIISFKDPVMITMIVILVVVLICGLVLLIHHIRNHYPQEQSQRKRVPNSVYEDMNLMRTQSMAR
ncbi:uncharacterized protein LOC127579962 [Pristis pectinata]|uniref:uncharacterized protein LOC127579962 n=1 Tax=Pristis pectinata TaxID=685728 RepID=UPI00223E20D4|nr:uncharacterized protein LOC127579962 [Pristis pectinata]